MAVKVDVPKREWIAMFRRANYLFLTDIGDFVSGLIRNEIERTWDNNYPINVLVDEPSSSVTVIWGNSGDPPSELSGGGNLTARFPKGATPQDQISKTIVGQLRSVQPVMDWVKIGVVIGTIIPREFDSLLIDELIKTYPVERRYAQALKSAGII